MSQLSNKSTIMSHPILNVNTINCSIVKGTTSRGEELMVNWYNNDMNWICIDKMFYDRPNNFKGLDKQFCDECYEFCEENCDKFHNHEENK